MHNKAPSCSINLTLKPFPAHHRIPLKEALWVSSSNNVSMPVIYAYKSTIQSQKISFHIKPNISHWVANIWWPQKCVMVKYVLYRLSCKWTDIHTYGCMGRSWVEYSTVSKRKLETISSAATLSFWLLALETSNPKPLFLHMKTIKSKKKKRQNKTKTQPTYRGA